MESREDLDDFVITEPNRKHLSFITHSLESVEARTESVGISFMLTNAKMAKINNWSYSRFWEALLKKEFHLTTRANQ